MRIRVLYNGIAKDTIIEDLDTGERLRFVTDIQIGIGLEGSNMVIHRYMTDESGRMVFPAILEEVKIAHFELGDPYVRMPNKILYAEDTFWEE